MSRFRGRDQVGVQLAPHPCPSPTQAGKGETWQALLAPLPEFGEGSGVGSKNLFGTLLIASLREERCAGFYCELTTENCKLP